MKPIKMHPVPETEKRSSPKEAPMEGAHGETVSGASLGGQDSKQNLRHAQKKLNRLTYFLNSAIKT